MNYFRVSDVLKRKLLQGNQKKSRNLSNNYLTQLILAKMINKFLKKGNKIILFDGVCNFCNSSVLKIIKHDKKNIFLFASLQSDIGFLIMKHFKIDSTKTDTIILVESEEKFHIKSTAALKILKEFNGLWKVLQICWIIPLFIRNSAYNYIAKNRYKWFGKEDSCMIPTKGIKSKFI